MRTRIFRSLLTVALVFQAINPIIAKHHNAPTEITIQFKPGHPINRFVPSVVFGAAISPKREIQVMPNGF
ncbi:MAG TPA: hypothetical protein DCK93_07765 [Blastocatellia bacterium]|jgi:hypothetical protein|nr:hypothetical protein [Blastocatellia bacterium]